MKHGNFPVRKLSTFTKAATPSSSSTAKCGEKVAVENSWSFRAKIWGTYGQLMSKHGKKYHGNWENMGKS